MLMPIRDLNPPQGSGFPFVTVALIVINILVFLGQVALPPRAQEALILGLGAIPAVVIGDRELAPALVLVDPWLTLVTSTFLHGGWMHLLGNMLFLWVFGDNIEAACGHVRFLVFYFSCGVGAALIHVVSDPTSTVPVVGASGAISGVLGAYLILHPRARVVLLVFFVLFAELPAVVVLSFWIAFQIFNALLASGGDSGVAWWAHIGGFFIGALLIIPFRKRGVPLFDRSTRRLPRHALLRTRRSIFPDSGPR